MEIIMYVGIASLFVSFKYFTLKTGAIFHLYFLINQAKHLEEKELMDLF